MKKLMIALAAVAIAAVSQASSVNWGVETDSTYKGWNAYLYKGTADAFASLLATQAPYDESGSSSMWAGGLGTALDSIELARKGGESSVDGVSAAGENWTVVLFDGAIDVGTNYALMETVVTTADMLYDKPSTPENSAVFSTIGATGTLTMAPKGGDVPEPTSGLLLILGMAGLALRRKLA